MLSASLLRRAVIGVLSTIALCLPAGGEERTISHAELATADPVNADELAALLGIHIWKLKVDPPPEDANRFHVALTLTELGREPRQVGAGIGGILGATDDPHLLIALVPIDGTIHSAEQLRVVLSGSFGMATGVEDNPFRGMGIGAPSRPEAHEDGSYNLIGGYRGRIVSSPVSSAAKVLSVKVTWSRE